MTRETRNLLLFVGLSLATIMAIVVGAALVASIMGVP